MRWDELADSSPDDVRAWAEDQPWCRAMADCRQDAGWHAEGDVWTHTKMVCAQLPRLDEWPDFTDHELHYVPYQAHRCTLTMMSGLPGSGKDAWLAAHRQDLPVVSLYDVRDDLRVDATDDQGVVIQAARERCRELLRSGRSFAFNATNLLRQTRRRWIDLFADYDARIEIVHIEPPLPMILERNRRRERLKAARMDLSVLSVVELNVAEAELVGLCRPASSHDLLDGQQLRIGQRLLRPDRLDLARERVPPLDHLVPKPGPYEEDVEAHALAPSSEDALA